MRTRLRVFGALVTTSVVAVAVPLLSGSQAEAALFTGGNLVVYRVGTSGGTLSNAAAPVFLDEFKGNAANTSPIQSIALPTTASNGNQPLTASGLSRSEGLISRSADGSYLAVTGYAAAAGAVGPAVTGGPTTSSIANSAPATVARSVALVDGNGIVDSSTVLTGASTAKVVRSAATDGDRIWATGGNGGIATTTLGSTTVSTVAGTADSNLNALTVQGGQLWSSGIVTNRLAQVGSGTPSTSASLTDVPGLPTNLLTYGYALLDLATGVGYGGTTLDTLYVANSSERGGTVDKYAYTQAAGWKLAGYKDVDGATGLVASQNGAAVSLAVTTPTSLLSLTDTNGSASTGFAPADPTTLATAPAGTEFRGVALAPTAPAATEGPSTFVRSPASGSTVVLGSAVPVSAYVDGPAAVTGVTLTLGSQTVSATPSGKVWSGSFSTSGLAAGPALVTVKATTATGTRTVTRSITLAAPPATTTPTTPTTPPVTTTPTPTAPAGAISAGTVSGADPKIVRKGSWKGGTAKKKNSTASATVFGRGLTLTFATGPKAGKVKVTVDGRAVTINLYAKKAGKSAKTFSLGALGSHSFVVTVLGKKTKKSKGTTVTLTSVQVTP